MRASKTKRDNRTKIIRYIYWQYYCGDGFEWLAREGWSGETGDRTGVIEFRWFFLFVGVCVCARAVRLSIKPKKKKTNGFDLTRGETENRGVITIYYDKKTGIGVEPCRSAIAQSWYYKFMCSVMRANKCDGLPQVDSNKCRPITFHLIERRKKNII